MEILKIPDNEFLHDMEYMGSMDTAWHHWMQPKWDREREWWYAREREKDERSGKVAPHGDGRVCDVGISAEVCDAVSSGREGRQA